MSSFPILPNTTLSLLGANLVQAIHNKQPNIYIQVIGKYDNETSLFSLVLVNQSNQPKMGYILISEWLFEHKVYVSSPLAQEIIHDRLCSS